jgi:hypothetical protein
MVKRILILKVERVVTDLLGFQVLPLVAVVVAQAIDTIL